MPFIKETLPYGNLSIACWLFCQEGFPYSGENALIIGLITSTSVLVILLVILILGLVYTYQKIKRSRKKAIKRDVNPLYGVEEEREAGSTTDYDYMGN